MRHRLVHQRQRLLELFLAGRLVPDEVKPMAGRHVPACLAELRRHIGAQAAARQQLDPSGIAGRQIGDGGHAGQQHFRQRIGAGAFRPALMVLEQRRAVVQRAHIELRIAQLLAHTLIGRLVVGMAVDVDEARQHDRLPPVDLLIRRPVIIRPDMQDRVAPEGNVDAAAIDMALRAGIPGNDPVGLTDHSSLGVGVVHLSPPACSCH